jgi:hypothetical protein
MGVSSEYVCVKTPLNLQITPYGEIHRRRFNECA